MAWLLRFKSWFIEKYARSSVNTKVQKSLQSGPLLSVDKVQRAEREVVGHVQRLSFPEVIQAMQKIRSLMPSHQLTSELKNLKIPAHIHKLYPSLDDMGILRVGGRLENVLIKYEGKHPIILLYRHQVTDLIISEHH